MDEFRVRTKLRELASFIEELDELRPSSSSVYHSSLEKRRAIERQLQIMVECIIDICYILASDLKLEPPRDDEHVIDSLQEMGAIPGFTRNMKGFRNVLVHKYGQIDDSRVYTFVSENSDDFSEFIDHVQRFLQRRVKPRDT